MCLFATLVAAIPNCSFILMEMKFKNVFLKKKRDKASVTAIRGIK